MLSRPNNTCRYRSRSIRSTGVNSAAGRSYSTCARSTPKRFWRNVASPRETQRFASTRLASRRSNHRAKRTAGCRCPRRRRRSVYPRLCQSITNRTPRLRSENQATASVGNAGGFCTSTTSGRFNLRSVRHRRTLVRIASTSPSTAYGDPDSPPRSFSPGGLNRCTAIRASSVRRFGSGVPSKPMKSTSTPLAASASA
jgi:hypothetical protein